MVHTKLFMLILNAPNIFCFSGGPLKVAIWHVRGFFHNERTQKNMQASLILGYKKALAILENILSIQNIPQNYNVVKCVISTQL